MNILKKIKILILISAVYLFGIFINAPTTKAASFEPGRIIDNSVFNNKNSMSVTDIQNFLNTKVPTCDTWHTAGPSAQGAVPPWICLKNYNENGKSAAQIIWEQAQNFNINPQVLIVTLQKENGLITDTWPYPWQYRTAMGFACPDNGTCDPAYYGFTQQVYQAARHFRNFYDLNPNWSIPFRPGINYIKWAPYNNETKLDTCGGNNVNIQNRATAALYSYTPYQPNSAALNNLYDNGDACSAYGNRNFWRDFNSWFGSTLGNTYTIIKSSTSPNQYVYESGMKRLIPSPEVKVAWDLQDQEIISNYSQTQIDSIPSRDGKPLSNIARIDGSQAVYLVDNGNKYYIPSLQTMTSWGLDSNNIVDVGVGIGSSPSIGGNLGYSVRSPNTSDQRIFMVDGGSLRPYSNIDVLRAWEGENPLSIMPSVGLFNSLGPIGSGINSNRITGQNQEFLVVAGQKLPSNTSISSLYPGTTNTVSTHSLSRLVTSAPASWFIRANDDTTVYMIDEGMKHAVQSPSQLIAWSPYGSPYINVVNRSLINSIPTGSPLTQYVANQSGQYFFFTGQKLPVPANLANEYANSRLGSFSVSSVLMSLYPNGPSASGFIRGASSPVVYILDGSNIRSVTDLPTFTLLNGARGELTTLVYDFCLSQFNQGSGMSAGVSAGGINYVFDNGVYYSVTAETSSNWGFGGYVAINPSTLSRFTSGGSLDSKVKSSGSYYLMRSGRSFSTSNLNVAELWNMPSAQDHSSLLTGVVVKGGILQPFFASSVAGDYRIFLKDTNNSYILTSPAQVYNYGFINSALPKLSGSEISILSDGQLSKNSVLSEGKYYIVDGGKKRPVAYPETINAWGLGNSANYISISQNLSSYLSETEPISVLIRGTAPNVYLMENGKKRWITDPKVLSQQYSNIAISKISDFLNELIQSGPLY